MCETESPGVSYTKQLGRESGYRSKLFHAAQRGDGILATLISLLVTVFVGAIILPRMNALRDLLGRFSELSIPTLEANNPFEELPIEETSRRAKQREEAVAAYNALYRDYAIKYGQFKRIGSIFLVLALTLVVLSAYQFQLPVVYRVLVACVIYLALLLAIRFLRADIAPPPDTVLSIDYIGKHYTKLNPQHLLEVAEPAVY